jgi:hypothetical protein
MEERGTARHSHEIDGVDEVFGDGRESNSSPKSVKAVV